MKGKKWVECAICYGWRLDCVHVIVFSITKYLGSAFHKLLDPGDTQMNKT